MLGCGGGEQRVVRTSPLGPLPPTWARTGTGTSKQESTFPSEWASNLQEQKRQVQCLEVSGDHRASNRAGHATLLPKQDLKGEETNASLRKKFQVKKTCWSFSQVGVDIFHSPVSAQPSLPGPLHHCPSLQHSPQMFPREKKAYQIADSLDSPKTWV